MVEANGAMIVQFTLSPFTHRNCPNRATRIPRFEILVKCTVKCAKKFDIWLVGLYGLVAVFSLPAVALTTVFSYCYVWLAWLLRLLLSYACSAI